MKKKYKAILFLKTSVLFVLSFCLWLNISAQTIDTSGMVLWLRSDSGVVLSGNTVQQWTDQSVNNNNAISISGVSLPILAQNSLNGHSSIKFDGSAGLKIPNVTLGNKGCSIFIVAKVNLKTSYGMFLTYGINSIGSWNFRQVENSGRLSFVNGAINSGAGAIDAVTPVGTTTNLEGLNFRILYGEINDNSDEWSIFENGDLKNSRSVGFAQSITESIYIGVRGDNIGFLNGELLEILIYDSTLTTNKRQQIEEYLKNKYTAPVNLGPDRTVCTLPITLKPKKDYFTSYLWQDNTTADSLIITAPGIYSITATDVFEKLTIDTITVTIDNSDYFVSLGNDTSICPENHLILNAGASHLNYTWSDNSNLNYLNVNSTGTYWVSAINCLGIISKDTIHVTLMPSSIFDLGNDLIKCFNDSLTLDPGFNNSNLYSFLWSDNSIDTVLPITNSGIYWLKVLDNNTCSYFDTINVSVDSTLALTSLGPDTSFCAGNFIYLKNGVLSGQNYIWSDNSINDSLAISNSGQYWLSITNNNGCANTDTINVTINGIAPIPNFTTINSCISDSTQFNDLSIPPLANIINSWNWNFGDGYSSNSQNPLHFFSDTGNYIVNLTIETNVGCEASILKTIKIYPNPIASYNVTNRCENSSSLFLDTTTNYGYPISQWEWYFGDPTSGTLNQSSIQNPVHLYNLPGTYNIILIVQNSFGCSDTLINNLVINALPISGFNNSLTCQNDSILFFDNSTIPPSTTIQNSFWDFNDNSTTNGLNPVHLYSLSGTYNVSHIVSTNEGCTDTLVLPIIVFPKPNAIFSYNNTCINLPINFNDSSTISSGIISTWLWNFNNSDFSTIQNPEFIYNSSGFVTAKLLVSSDHGCKDSITQTIFVSMPPVANFTYNIEYGNPPIEVNFINTSNGAMSYFWNFGDGSQSTIQNPVHTYQNIGTYNVSLIVTNISGCTDTIKKNIIITIAQLPSNIEGLSLWLKADSGIVLNINNIQQWNDQSSNNNNAVLINGINSPIFIQNSLNGYPSIKFNGNEGLKIPAVNLSNNGSSIFIVAKLNTKTSYGMFLTYGINNLGNWNFRQVENLGRLSFVHGATNIGAGALSAATPAGTTIDLEGLNFRILYGDVNSNTDEWSLWENGNLKDTRSENFDQSLTESLYIGVRGDNVGFLNGEILEIIIYDTCLTSENRKLIEQYLRSKYTAPVSLGPDRYVCSLPITLNPKKDYFTNYLWQDNTTADSLIITIPGTYSITATDVFEKTTIDSVFIGLDTTNYQINLSNDTTVCFGQFSLIAGLPHLSYTWSDGSHLNYLNINSSETYWVSTTNCKGVESSDSIDITVMPNSIFNFANDTVKCFNNDFVLDPSILNSNLYSFVWSNNSTDSTLQVYNSGNYWVNITDLYGCSYRDTIVIAIDSSLNNVNLGSDTTLCSGNSISPSGGNNITNYLWIDSSTNQNLVINSTGNYWVSVTNINGCVAKDTIHINIHGIAPVAGFSNSAQCVNNQIVFYDTSQTLDGSQIIDWQWIINNDTTVTQNTSNIFNNIGNYQVLLTITTDSNCSNTVSKNITIHPNPIAAYSVAGTCMGGTSYFTNLSSVSTGYLSNMDWSFGDNNSSIVLNPQHTFSDIGFYQVQLISTSNEGCKDSISKTIEIKPSPLASFDFSPACTGSATWFFDLTQTLPIFPITIWNWNFGDGDSSLQQNPQHVYNSVGQYPVSLIIKSLNGCADTLTNLVSVSAPPNAGFVGDSTCFGLPLNFTDTSSVINGSIYKWHWNFGNGIASNLPNPSAYYNSIGNYTVNLKVTSTVDCIDEITKVIKVFPLPVPNFLCLPNLGAPPLSVNLINSTTNDLSYWDFGDGQTSLLNSPIHVFNDTGNYTIWLKSENSHGCVDSTYKYVKVVPNIHNLAVLSIDYNINSTYLTTSTTIANIGTMPIINPLLTLSTDKSTPIMEIYPDTLFSGQIVNYNFNAQLPYSETSPPTYVCVKGILSEEKIDVDLSNNEACKTNSTNQLILNLYPNPTNNEINLDLNIIIPGNSMLDIFDKEGRFVYSNQINLVPGFNRLKIDIRTFAKGKYTLRLNAQEGENSVEFIKY